MFEDLSEDELTHRAWAPLTPRAAAVLRAQGTPRQTAAGERLIAVDDRPYPLIFAISATVEVRDHMGLVLGTFGPDQFTGDLGLLLGQGSSADCIVVAPGEVRVIDAPTIAGLVQTDPDVSEALMSAFAARRLLLVRHQQGTLSLIGPEGAHGLQSVATYAERNRIPYRWLDPADPDHAAEISACGAEAPGLKVVVRGRHVLENPTIEAVARALGLALSVQRDHPVDLIVAGAGPAGLSAAVYGASEGLRTVLLDDVAVGGQSAASSRIENYLGFPVGLSGADLAFRAELQAVKFGAQVGTPRHVRSLKPSDTPGHYDLALDDGAVLCGRAVVIATGARYRKLGLEGEERLQGDGVFYAATELEARPCKGADVIVVGGGNSAGQAAMFLSSHAACVRLVCRGRDLADTMSDYLVVRLRAAPNVSIEMRSAVVELFGDERLEAVNIRDGEGQLTRRPACGLFVMIGADPCTGWLKDTILVDDRGFIITGEGCGPDAPAPYNLFQTSLPGVFAVGDVRSGSVKRVASAVGEGAVVVKAIHERLAHLRRGEAEPHPAAE